MAGILTRSRHLLIAILGVSLVASVGGSAYGQKKSKKAKKSKSAQTGDLSASVEPDKVLYDRAIADIKHGRYTEGRLSLQTLINTYPDSEYLAKAKLAVADSYYKEGGTSGLTQAVDEYKNFIIFFPFLDEAAYSQMQVGMAHYRMMEKPDRDRTQAEDAEVEFQTFLLKYPQSPLSAQAEQKLRDVQEVLADGEFKIARFYFVKQDYRASAARLVELTNRYPLYSQSDEALWMLGDVYSRAKQLSKNEDEKNHWADLAAKCYDRIVRDYPLSRRAQPSQSRLTAMGMPVPAADPDALVRMQKQQEYAKQHRQNALLKLPLGILKSRPNVSSAARGGQPNLNPPSDTVSASDVLKPGAAGPSFTISASAEAGEGATGGESAPVEVTSSGAPVTAATAPTSTAAVEIVAAPTGSDASPATSAARPTNPAAPNTAGNSSSTAGTAAEGTPASSTSAPTTQGGSSTGDTSAASNGSNQQVPSKSAATKPSEKSDPKTESTSKKKKGLRKIIPW